MAQAERQPGQDLAGLAPAIDWLYRRGVSPVRLSGLLQTSPGHIRVLSFRYRHAPTRPIFLPPRLVDLDGTSADEQRRVLPIRSEPFAGLADRRSRQRLSWLEEQIEATIQQHAGSYEFSRGSAALKLLLPYLGRPADVRRVRLLARLHRHRAWFEVHAGQCESALRTALEALDLSEYCYRESSDPTYLWEVIEAAQIASNAALLSSQPESALRILRIVPQAYERLSTPVGSEYFRQSGTAHLQLGDFEEARHHFRQAMRAMEQRGEARNPAHLLMTGTRQMNLLGQPNWERALEISGIAAEQFGPESLEHVMNINWAAACGLATDSPSTVQQATDMVNAAPEASRQFGHQTTVRTLLSLTPELGLPVKLRRDWIRFALYQNRSRNR